MLAEPSDFFSLFFIPVGVLPDPNQGSPILGLKGLSGLNWAEDWMKVGGAIIPPSLSRAYSSSE